MSKLKHIVDIVVNGSKGLDGQKAREAERERRIILTAFTGAVAKAIATAIPLVSVKFSLSYLGDELYGLWATVTSFFAMFTFADLGLGNGLQTELSRANGGDDISYKKKLVSSTYFVLTAIAIVLLLIFLPLYPLLNWAKIMNAESEKAVVLSGGFVLAIVCSKIFEIPMGLVQRTQNALQEGYKSYIWQICSSLLSLILIIIISRLNLGAVTMIWAASLTVSVVSLINMIVYFGFQKSHIAPSSKYIDIKTSRSLLKIGIEFFVLSLVTSVSLSFDNFIVSQISSLSETTPYSLAYKFAHVLGIVSIMLSTPMWSANGEALARGDYDWVKKRTKTMALLSLLLSVVGSIIIIIFVNPVMSWMGKDLSISYFTLSGMCVLQVLIAIINPYFMVLNAGRIIKKQIYMFSIYAVVSVALKWILGKTIGTCMIPWIGAICYAVIVIPYTFLTVQKLFQRNSGETK
ncbi:MAG TPA: MATE family efflux transporter [Oscillospiraceae bacterium]|mgnify:CR=1 FL=1|nr:MATE family efflux transporter [Oscillospiraceae bacterium]HPS35113.1 MATE family efflux transporter [Oscillospiraceae bacterium]